MMGWRSFRSAGIVLPLLALGGCAIGHASTAMTAPGIANPAAQGVILSARHVILQIAGGQNGVLGALGAPQSEGMAMAPATEFIIRQDNGRIVSVLQPVPNDFRPGERVRIIRGVETRLRPLT